MKLDMLNISKNGYVFLESFEPSLSILEVAEKHGHIYKPADKIHHLRPMSPARELNTYRGNFGLAEYPLHTDLAHFATPPRYMILRAKQGSSLVTTNLLHTEQVFDQIPVSRLRRILLRGRRPLNGKLYTFNLLEKVELELRLRWDLIFLQPLNSLNEEGFRLFSTTINSLAHKKIALKNQTDTLIVDNWKTLHGRSPVPQNETSRCIERIYLSGLNYGY